MRSIDIETTEMGEDFCLRIEVGDGQHYAHFFSWPEILRLQAAINQAVEDATK